MKVAIVGAGPAGLMSAGTALADEILLLDGNEKVGKKLFITGKGRCNVTNDCAPDKLVFNIVSNPKFFISAANAFTPSDTVALLNSFGVKTKVERGGRVFPLSDKSSDVISALERYAVRNGAEILLGQKVVGAKKTGEKFCVFLGGGDKIFCDKLVLATGGMSYPATGSTGDGYKIAASFGHNIVAPRPALVPIKLKENVSRLEGLSLKNVNVTLTDGKKTFSKFGEMLFTSFGASGPVVLSLSSLINSFDASRFKLVIDLKPALDHETLDKRILSDFEKNINRDYKNSLSELLPKSLIPYIIEKSGIPPETKVNSITRDMRRKLALCLKELTFSVDSLMPTEAGIVTAGGVNVKQVNPKTMESKIVSGLYFAGEILDLDAFTGGYNIQIALSTGYSVGKFISHN